MYLQEADNVYLTREHIIEQMKSGQIGALFNAYSISEESFLFTDYIRAKKEDPITGRETDEYLNDDIFYIKSIWLRYMRKIYNTQKDILFEYHSPYKSGKLSYISELSVYINGVYQYGQQFSSKIDAECQGYIYNFCKGNIMSPHELANTVNSILAKQLEAYNYINNDDAKFIVDNHNMLGAESKCFSHNFGVFLFNELLNSDVLRGSKIDKLLD